MTEAPVGAQHLEVPLFAGLDRGRDAPGDGVVLREVLTLFDVDGPDVEQGDANEHDEQEDGGSMEDAGLPGTGPGDIVP